MKKDYERISSDSFKNKQYIGKKEIIVVAILLFLMIFLKNI